MGKGRGGPDAQARALAALEERRKKENAVKEQMGLTRAPASSRRERPPDKFEYIPLNSSREQVRASKRAKKHQSSQGVQQNDDDAVKVVHKAIGGDTEGAKPKRVEDTRNGLRQNRKKARSSSEASLG